VTQIAEQKWLLDDQIRELDQGRALRAKLVSED
jgi:hypothetical protein